MSYAIRFHNAVMSCPRMCPPWSGPAYDTLNVLHPVGCSWITIRVNGEVVATYGDEAKATAFVLGLMTACPGLHVTLDWKFKLTPHRYDDGPGW